MRKFDLYIGGEWVKSTGDSFIEVENPATKEIIGIVPRGNDADADRAVKAARAAAGSWAQTLPAVRAALMRKLAGIIEKRKDEFSLTISHELGIPLKYAFDYHVAGSIATAEFYANIAENFKYETKIEGGIIRREPVGVVAGLTPWNYPLGQATYKLFPAIAAGNCVVLKPSQMTPLCACMLAEAIHEAGFPAGVFNLVSGAGGEVGNVLAAHDDVDMISFTGSTSAGKEVGRLSLGTVKKIALELGGKSPLIILEGADCKAAVAAVCSSAFMNSGQTCCAYTRLLVPKKIKHEIEELLKSEAAKYKTGDPLDSETQVGPLISEKAFNKVKAYIQSGVDDGAKLITGEIPENCDKGYFVKPTIFTDVTNDMKIAREEIFGPVLSVIYYDTLDEAVEIANDTPYGLAGAVFGPEEAAYEIAKMMKAGVISINGAPGDMQFPFGGYKQSGIGREGGIFGFEEFLEVKAIKK